MQKFILTILFIPFLIVLTQAQVYYEEEVRETKTEEVNENSLSHLSFAERSYFGGNLALSFGTNTFIDVSPLWGYMIDRNLSMGLGATYIYLSREYYDFFSNRTIDVKSSLYGGRTFLRYRVFDQYYFHTEFESINNEVPRLDGSGTTQREWIPGLFIGAGIFQPAFKRGGVSLFVMYNLLHDELKSPYGSAWVIRAGFTL